MGIILYFREPNVLFSLPTVQLVEHHLSSSILGHLFAGASGRYLMSLWNCENTLQQKIQRMTFKVSFQMDHLEYWGMSLAVRHFNFVKWRHARRLVSLIEETNRISIVVTHVDNCFKKSEILNLKILSLT